MVDNYILKLLVIGILCWRRLPRLDGFRDCRCHYAIYLSVSVGALQRLGPN